MRELHRPSAAIAFVSGAPTPALAVAQAIADLSYRVPTLVVPSSGVLTQAAEVEGALAVTGVAWSARGASIRVAIGDTARDIGSSLGSGGSLASFWASDGFEPAEVSALSRDRQCLFGAGSPGNHVHLVDNGKVSSGRVAAMRFDGGGPIVEASSACRLVSDSMTVTQIDRGMVTRLDGEPALDVLTAKAGGGRHGGLILVAIHDFSDPDRYLVRPIRGIDPGRKGVAIVGDLNVGDRVSFAVRDPACARDGLTEAARRAERHALGSQPTFGLYLSCAGRGRSLYGESDVDIRILKKRFPGIPIAGMHSAFEVVPWGIGSSKMQLMNGVFALFRAPS
ncbi:MAG: hypothetical protein HOW73_44585 [Polyangiaceae bacterium]|nr:hypothetical protein [Polyangiaceae bacterium]